MKLLVIVDLVVNIQAMVFGNMGDDCCTGVAFTRNPSNGKNEIYGECHEIEHILYLYIYFIHYSHISPSKNEKNNSVFSRSKHLKCKYKIGLRKSKFYWKRYKRPIFRKI